MNPRPTPEVQDDPVDSVRAPRLLQPIATAASAKKQPTNQVEEFPTEWALYKGKAQDGEWQIERSERPRSNNSRPL